MPYYFTTVSVLFYFVMGIALEAQSFPNEVKVENDEADQSRVEYDFEADYKKCLNEWSNVSQYEHKRRIFNLINNSLEEVHLKKRQQKFGCIPGEVMIGIVSPIHKRSGQILNDNEQSYLLKCGTETDFSTTVAIQFFLWMLDLFNEIWPFFNVGAFIFDDCGSDVVAQYQIMKLLESTSLNPDNSTLKVSCSTNGSLQQGPGPVIGIVDVSDTEGFAQSVQGLLNTLKYPISKKLHTFETTEDIAKQVENHSWYTFTDNFIIFHILKQFGWTYISVIVTEEYQDLSQFYKLAEYHKVCITKVEQVHRTVNSEHYRNLIRSINTYENARAVVCFCKGNEVINKVFQAVNYLNMSDRFIFISSGDKSSHADVIFDKLPYSPILLTFHKSLAFQSETDEATVLQDFVDKSFRINEMSTRNPWLREAWQNEFNCSFNETGDLGTWRRQCTGKEITVEHINTLLTKRSLAHVANDLIHLIVLFFTYVSIQCHGWKPHHAESLDCRKHFFESFKDVSSKARSDYFCWIHTNVSDMLDFSVNALGFFGFDECFDIVVHQKSLYDRLDSTIGRGQWDYINSKMNVTIDKDKSNLKYVKSVCSETCSFGQKKVVSNPATPCCWTCERCLENEILSNDNYCLPCGEKEWPNMNQTECVEMKVMRINWMDLEGIFCLTYAVSVITLASGSIVIFIKYQNTPVVKSSTKELSFIMLIAVISANCVVFIKLADCTVVTCAAIRILVPLSLSAIYSALLVKTVRIARLLALSRNKFPKLSARFMSTKAQVIMTLILLALKISLICLGLYFVPNDVLPLKISRDDGQPVIKYVCSFNTQIVIVNYIFPTVLVLLCTICAVWTRNVPDNFNEAKYIGFSMYATCITWFGFILAQYQRDMEILSLCFSSSTSTFIILIFLFFPKIYVILWLPKENDRRFFVTSRSIRVNFGRLMSKRHIRSSRHTETSKRTMDENR